MSTLSVLALPALLLVAALAVSFQASSARRVAASAWRDYEAGAAVDAALAEATHCLRVADLFDPAVFGAAGADFAPALHRQMARRQLPGVAAADRLEQPIQRRGNGRTAHRLLVGFRFPPRATPVALRGVAADIAGGPVSVTVTPLLFYREWRARARQWVNWGLLRFHARAGGREREVVRRFALLARARSADELLKVSGVDLVALPEDSE